MAGLGDSKLPQEKGGSSEGGHSTEVGQGGGGPGKWSFRALRAPLT